MCRGKSSSSRRRTRGTLGVAGAGVQGGDYMRQRSSLFGSSSETEDDSRWDRAVQEGREALVVTDDNNNDHDPSCLSFAFSPHACWPPLALPSWSGGYPSNGDVH